MRECPYELYVSVYCAIREGAAAGDEDIVHRVSMHLVGRHSVTLLAMTLALIEATHGAPQRTKDGVCNALCDRAQCDHRAVPAESAA